jgi:CheY-like chemotaxis protein
MHSSKLPALILMADDDEDDRLLAYEALQESNSNFSMRFVKDGVELMHYLRGEGKYRDHRDAPRPDLILLDLNMPRKDGREVLVEVKDDPALAAIPIVILTTSSTKEDVEHCRAHGAAAYRTKPVTFSAMVDLMRGLDSLCPACELITANDLIS